MDAVSKNSGASRLILVLISSGALRFFFYALGFSFKMEVCRDFFEMAKHGSNKLKPSFAHPN